METRVLSDDRVDAGAAGGRPCARSLRVVGTAILAAVVTACGSSGGAANQTNGARTQPTVALRGALVITAPFALTAAFTDDISTAATAGATCAEAAKGFMQDGPRYEPPHNPQGAPFDTHDGKHHAITVTLHVVNYVGPGAYGKTNIAGDFDLQLLQVDGQSYGTASGGDISLQVNTDNSGKLTFAGLTLAPAPPPEPTPTPTGPATPAPKPTPLAPLPPLSGTLTWTCVQVRAPTPSPTPAPIPARTPTPGLPPTPTPHH